MPAGMGTGRRSSSASVASMAVPSSLDHMHTFTEALSKIQRRFRHSGKIVPVFVNALAFHTMGFSFLLGFRKC